MARLYYAFSRHIQCYERELPYLVALYDRVVALSNIAAYLESSRRIPFNMVDTFRHCPELDTLK